MVTKSKTKSKKHTKVRKVRRGGGQGFGYGPGSALLPGVQLDAQVHQRYDACAGADRPGQLAFATTGGLPGMKGGRYSVDVGSPTIAGFAEVNKVPCEAPLTRTAQAGGVGLQSASDMGVLQEGTARYTTAPSGWVSQVGAPVLLNQPLDQVAWSKACTQTAGRRTRMKKRSRSMKKRK